MWFKSVHARFMLVLLPLFILSFVALSGITYYMARESLTENAVKIAQGIGSEAALQLRISIDNIHAPLKLAAGNDSVRSGDEERILRLLNRLKDASPLIAQTFYIRPDGRTLRADGKHLDRSSREYFKRVSATHKPYISKAFMGETTKTMQTMVLQPILVDGKLDGILMASIHLRELAWLTFADRRMEGCKVYVIDNEGLVVGCNDHTEYVGSLNLIQGGGDSAGLSVDPRLSGIIQDSLGYSAQTFAAFSSIDGGQRFATVTPFDLAGNRWAVACVFPLARVTAPVTRLLQTTTLAFCLILAAAVGAIMRFAKSISAPLENIAREMSSIDAANGASARGDEIGVLAEGVAKMRGLRDEKEHFEQKASMDELTGLLNRFGFRRQVSEAVAENAGRAATLVFADLDHLKHINDRIGHAAGDEALVTAAEILREGFGEDAVIGRVGGDEFAAFFCAESGGGEERLRRVREAAARRNEEDGKPYFVEFSLGMTEFVCAPEVNLWTLLERADVCLYDAKRHRRATSLREDAPKA